MSELFERVCPICQSVFLTDGGEITCGDIVCETVYNRMVEQAAATEQVEALLEAAHSEQYAKAMGL